MPFVDIFDIKVDHVISLDLMNEDQSVLSTSKYRIWLIVHTLSWICVFKYHSIST